MSIVIFYLYDNKPECLHYKDTDFVEALDHTQRLRRAEGVSHVVMSNEPSNMVGKPGVESVDNGKTPDGYPYEWSKQHRGAGPRKE